MSRNSFEKKILNPNMISMAEVGLAKAMANLNLEFSTVSRGNWMGNRPLAKSTAKTTYGSALKQLSSFFKLIGAYDLSIILHSLPLSKLL